MKITRMRIFGVALLACGLGVAAYGAAVWYVNNVETPNYDVVTSNAEFEIRDYPSLVVAEVIRRGDRKTAVNEGFYPLASYIFAKKRTGEPISMTAPVTQSEDDGGKAWTVRFIMPAEYSLKMLPEPADSDIRLIEVPAGRRAAIRFNGVATDALIVEKEQRLRAWLRQLGIEPIGTATYAYYNAPFTPGFLRRNEVLFEVADN